MAAPFPSSSRMDAWPQRRGLQNMNLRSVFTIEQQRILERYYENGMTNQSKACFQLILQCAQEAKLDFSVVRTWVGNKRRKIASKADQNGAVSHALSSHGLSGGLLSNHTLSGGTLPSPALVAGPLLPADVATARSIQNRVHLFPQSSTFPSFSSKSSSPSSSSPLSSGSGNNHTNNNDVILTGIYSLNSVPHSRPRPTAPATQSDSERSANPLSSLTNPTLHNKTSSGVLPFPSKPVSLVQNPTSLTPASGPVVHISVRKGTLSSGETGVSAATGVIPHSWTKQYGTAHTVPWSSSSQTQTQPRPHSNPQPQSAAPQKVRVSLPLQASGSSSTPRIQKVFTLSERGEWNKLISRQETTPKSQESCRPRTSFLDTSHNFSIAMETGNEEDEWQREEELATMAAQTHLYREQRSPNGGELCMVNRSSNTQPTTNSKPPMVQSNASLQSSYSLTAQTSLTESSSQTLASASAGPWIMSNSRKRTLQDRTQFSDGDLVQLKRYWDRGMTSLGSVCKDKINAAANELNVDTEIVKTWISNRRRKYRLMGIEIPPPKGGPAVFTISSPGNESPVALSPDVDRLQTPDLTDDMNDGLSEDGTIDSHNREGEDEAEMSTAPLANNIKIEVSDDDDLGNDDGCGDMMASDLEQMQSLLEFKHEEVQFLESELELQKQRYQELASFTKNLVIAFRNKDLGRQEELIDSLPQSSDQNWFHTVEEEIQVASSLADDCTHHKGFPGSGEGSNDSPPTPANEDTKNKVPDFTEPSASEGTVAVEKDCISLLH